VNISSIRQVHRSGTTPMSVVAMSRRNSDLRDITHTRSDGPTEAASAETRPVDETDETWETCMSQLRRHRFTATFDAGEVSALCLRPADAWSLLVFGHGAGAGAEHPFMAGCAERLARRGVATFRYQFPYMEQGRKAPNPPRVLVGTVRAAVQEAATLAPDLPLLAGGKSMGGRMTSTAAAAEPLRGVLGLAFFGFPLHAAERPSAGRGAHLANVGLPMLFLQGTRDKLADLELLGPLVEGLDFSPTLHVVDGADHGFHMLKRSGRTDEEVLDELCDVFVSWAEPLTGTTR